MNVTETAISQARSLALTLAFNAVRAYATSGVFDRISLQARNLIFSEMTNEQKGESLKTFIKYEGIVISGMLRDAIVAITRLRFEQ